MRKLSIVLLGLLVGCGDGDRQVRVPQPGPYFGQAIWLTYFSPEHASRGRRVNRPRKQARHLAERLRREVLEGANIGALARRHSNAPGGSADGMTPAFAPGASDPRARALARVAIGGVTEVVEWEGGWWFARRVDAGTAERLRTLFERLSRERASFRAIALLHTEAWVADPEVKKRIRRTKAEALQEAEALLERIRRGEDFATLASRYSEDAAGRRHGGLVTLPAHEAGWEHYVRRFEAGVPQQVLDVVFSSRPGELYPRVIDTPRGVFLIRTEDRRRKED